MSDASVLVTGGCGFIGSNLVNALASRGHSVTILDTLSRPGVEFNLEWLRQRHGQQIRLIKGDVRDRSAVGEAVAGASAIFHLAAQVAVTTSLSDPREDFEVNLQGTLNVLEQMRSQGAPVPFIFASTNKVYGDLADVDLEAVDDAYRPTSLQIRSRGIDEGRPVDFHTPYGCSKGAADQYVLDYTRSYGVPTCVFRMSCIYGPRQMGTEDQGWVAHFILKALRGECLTIYGDGMQVRDVLHVDDAVNAYLAAWDRMDQVKGQAFNLGGGPDNAISLMQLVDLIAERTGSRPDLSFEDWRAGDQRYYVSDTAKARAALALGQFTPWTDGVSDLVRWMKQESPLLRREAGSRIMSEAAE